MARPYSTEASPDACPEVYSVSMIIVAMFYLDTLSLG